MKPFILSLALLCSGCATFRMGVHNRYHNPDGSLNVRMIVSDASYGIEADCALGQTALSQDICTYGREAVNATHAVTTNDPVLLKKSVAAILEQATHEKPQLAPYFEFGLKLLEAA